MIDKNFVQATMQTAKQKKIDNVDKACGYCSDFATRPPELHTIEMYEGTDTQGCKYYYLDVERPTGFIPEPWRNRRLYIRYCPLCSRKLI